MNRSKKKTVTVNSWEVFDYPHTMYHIFQNEDDTYKIIVQIFLKVTGSIETDEVISIETGIYFQKAEVAFVYLQTIGPLFKNSSHVVFVVNNDNTIRYSWDLTKPVTQQVGVNLTSQPSEEPSNSILSDREKEQQFREQQTHPGNWRIN